MDIQIKKGVMEICILAILSKNDTCERKLCMIVQKEFETSEMIVLSILKKMQKEGWITAEIRKASQSVAPKIYSITSLGEEQFEYLRYEWYELNQAAKKFLSYKQLTD